MHEDAVCLLAPGMGPDKKWRSMNPAGMHRLYACYKHKSHDMDFNESLWMLHEENTGKGNELSGSTTEHAQKHVLRSTPVILLTGLAAAC